MWNSISLITPRISIPLCHSIRTTTKFSRVVKPKLIRSNLAKSQELINQYAQYVEDNQRLKVVQEEFTPQPVKVIVLKNTEDFGRRGQIVTVEDPMRARTEILLPGLGVYASEDNLKKYQDILIPEDQFRFSSEYIKNYLPTLSRRVLAVKVNLHGPKCKLEPVHIWSAFRHQNVNVPLESIELPDKEIIVPDLKNHSKEFIVHITINQTERIPIRAVLKHISKDSAEEDALHVDGWIHHFHEPLFEEDRDALRRMKRQRFGFLASRMEQSKPHYEKYLQWRKTRDQDLQNV